MAKKFSILNNAGKVIEDDNALFNKEFYEKHFGKILVVIILLMSYVQLRYEYEDCLVSISRLKQERNDVRYTSIEKWGILTLRNRPEKIREQVANSGVGLIESDERPVWVK